MKHGKDRSYTWEGCRCVKCTKAHSAAVKKWRDANPEKHKASQRAYKEANRDKYREAQKRYRERVSRGLVGCD